MQNINHFVLNRKLALKLEVLKKKKNYKGNLKKELNTRHFNKRTSILFAETYMMHAKGFFIHLVNKIASPLYSSMCEF